jgi:hypothetical protein
MPSEKPTMHDATATALNSVWRPEQAVAASANDCERTGSSENSASASGGFSHGPAHRIVRGVLLLAAATAGISLTGCQVDVGGQTLPSGYYLQDDIQYFPAGPEFKLSKEAAAQKEFRDEQATKDPHCTTCR